MPPQVAVTDPPPGLNVLGLALRLAFWIVIALLVASKVKVLLANRRNSYAPALAVAQAMLSD